MPPPRVSRARFMWRAFKARFRDEATELKTIRGALAHGGTAVDVGANKGSYLYWLARWAGRVIAFEPQEELAAYLAGAVRRLALANVAVEAKAVSDLTGTVMLHVPLEGSSPSASVGAHVAAAAPRREVSVESVALDDYLADDSQVRALKIDVEGHELNVLRGAQRILAEQGPLVVVECESRHLSGGRVEDVFGFLAEFGYAGSFVWRGRRLPLEQFSAEVHQRQHGERFWDAKDYANNFIFAKSAR